MWNRLSVFTASNSFRRDAAVFLTSGEVLGANVEGRSTTRGFWSHGYFWVLSAGAGFRPSDWLVIEKTVINHLGPRRVGSVVFTELRILIICYHESTRSCQYGCKVRINIPSVSTVHTDSWTSLFVPHQKSRPHAFVFAEDFLSNKLLTNGIVGWCSMTLTLSFLYLEREFSMRPLLELPLLSRHQTHTREESHLPYIAAAAKHSLQTNAWALCLSCVHGLGWHDPILHSLSIYLRSRLTSSNHSPPLYSTFRIRSLQPLSLVQTLGLVYCSQ